MRLQDQLYSIVSAGSGESFEFDVRLEPEHPIYKAHFPGEPITPGVCLLQIAVELLETATGRALAPETVKNIKFLKIIRPEETPVLKYVIDAEWTEASVVKARVEVRSEGEVYAKLSMVCREQQ